MARPGDVKLELGPFGIWTNIITDVDDEGKDTGGWLLPPGQPKELIDDLVQEAKRLAAL